MWFSRLKRKVRFIPLSHSTLRCWSCLKRQRENLDKNVSNLQKVVKVVGTFLIIENSHKVSGVRGWGWMKYLLPIISFYFTFSTLDFRSKWKVIKLSFCLSFHIIWVDLKVVHTYRMVNSFALLTKVLGSVFRK